MIIERGDIVLIRFPFADASAFKRRPVCVISDESFNRRFQSLIAVMITSQSHPERLEYAISSWRQSGLALPSYIRLTRFFSTDNAFVYRSLGRLPDAEMQIVMRLIREFL